MGKSQGHIQEGIIVGQGKMKSYTSEAFIEREGIW